MTKTEPNNVVNFPGDKPKTEIDRAGGLRTKRVGLTAVFTEISKQIGLWADAESAFGPRAARLAHALAYHRLMTEANSLSLFAPWAEGYLLPSDDLLSGESVVAFETALGETPAVTSTFFAARAAHAARFGDEPLCAYDLSSIAAQSLNPVGTAFGLSTGGAVGKKRASASCSGLRAGCPCDLRSCRAASPTVRSRRTSFGKRSARMRPFAGRSASARCSKRSTSTCRTSRAPVGVLRLR